MEIFKNDDLLDNEDGSDSDYIKNTGFNTSLDRNKMIKTFDSAPVRSSTMQPLSSNIKTFAPFDLVFNSLLAKSKILYNKNPTNPPE